MTTLESTEIEGVSLADEHTSETFEESEIEPDLGSGIDQLLAAASDQSTPEIAPTLKTVSEKVPAKAVDVQIDMLPHDENPMVASNIHTGGKVTEGEIFKIVSRKIEPGSAAYLIEKAEINRAAEQYEEDFDKDFTKKSLEQRGADILQANYVARTAQSKKFMSPKLADRPVADEQVDEVTEIFDGMRAKPAETPIDEKGVIHHVLPNFKPVDQGIKKDPVDASHEQKNDMEEFLSSKGSMKQEVKVEDVQVVAPTPELEKNLDKPTVEQNVPSIDIHETKPVVDVLATIEPKKDVAGTNPTESADGVKESPAVESPVKIPQPEVIRVEATRVKEEEVKSAEQTPEQIRIAALEKTNQELREQLRMVLEQQRANEARNNARFEEFMKVLKEKQKHEADLAEESRKTIEKLAKELAEKNKTEVKVEKKAKVATAEREVDENSAIVLTEADIIHDAEPKRFPPRDSAEMYRLYISKDPETKKRVRAVGLSSSEIGIAANKYFDDLVQKITTEVHNRNELRKELRKEKHSIPKRIATLGLSGTYRRSAHDEGANKIVPEIKSRDVKIKKMLAELKNTEKDTRRSPIKTRIDARKKEIKTLRALAR